MITYKFVVQASDSVIVKSNFPGQPQEVMRTLSVYVISEIIIRNCSEEILYK